MSNQIMDSVKWAPTYHNNCSSASTNAVAALARQFAAHPASCERRKCLERGRQLSSRLVSYGVEPLQLAAAVAKILHARLPGQWDTPGGWLSSLQPASRTTDACLGPGGRAMPSRSAVA